MHHLLNAIDFFLPLSCDYLIKCMILFEHYDIKDCVFIYDFGAIIICDDTCEGFDFFVYFINGGCF